MRPWSPAVRLADGPAGEPPLFCIHGGGGNVLIFADLARVLRGERPVYALEARGLAEGQTPLDRIEDMATLYLAAIREIQPHGPYQILGYSIGSRTAVEIARRLEESGEAVDRLILVDHAATALEGGEEDLNPEVPDLPDLDPEAVRRHLAVWRSCWEAARSWNPQPYGGGALLIVAEEGIHAAAADPALGWGSVVAGGVEVVRAPGDHFTVLARPQVEDLVACLAEKTQRT